ncbi:BfmA/BtgA family mobilization protein [Flavivirga algicola]|uniref:BfmA/BtgA family mobilization protein n=1 Tax=Flavivirga algicola TaxID=2729136 RepID=UPI00374460CE
MIRLKKKVIEKFKEYSKKTSLNYFETLDCINTFFEDTVLSYDLWIHLTSNKCTKTKNTENHMINSVLL